MSSKISHSFINEQNDENYNRMRQRESQRLNTLSGLGNFSNINNMARRTGPPLSSSYLQDDIVPGAFNSSIPPLPPRNEMGSMSRFRYSGFPGTNRYSSLNSLYSPYSPSRYSSLYSGGLYSPMSSYRMPYGHYGAPNDAYNSFVQMAEESTRPAFESIESVVHVVNSISMMLESTYGAVHSSYSAILGVVDQFSRLKDHLAHIFSVLALLRSLRWLCLKVLYLLGFRKENPSMEEAWQTARQAAATGVFPSNSNGSAWPFLMFLSLVIGAPWLMFKLLSKNVAKKPFDPNMWKNSKHQKYATIAAYDFAATQPGELSFRTGEKLILLPSEVESGRLRQRSWIMACNEQNETGLIPSNYLRTPNSNQRNEVRSVLPILQNDGQSTVSAMEQGSKNSDAVQITTVPDSSRKDVPALNAAQTMTVPGNSSKDPALNAVQRSLSSERKNDISVLIADGENSNITTPTLGDENIVPEPNDISKENAKLPENFPIEDVETRERKGVAKKKKKI